MSNKPKFNPLVTAIKLNPEQAVLVCSCWDRRRSASTTGTRTNTATLCWWDGRRSAGRIYPRYNTRATSAATS